LLKYFKKR